MKTVLNVIAAAIIAGLIGCRASPGVHHFLMDKATGLRLGVMVTSTSVRANQPVEFTFVVKNESTKTIQVPVPNYATLSFNTVVEESSPGDYGTGGHTAPAADPGSRDRWTQLPPQHSLSYTFSHQWPEPGTYKVYLMYYSRFEDKPFPKLQTPAVTITVE